MHVIMLRSVAFLFLLLVCTYPAQAQRSLEKAISKRGDDVLVERNEKTGSAHRVYGLDVNAKKYIATINQESIPILAQAIFDDYAEILSINPRDIEITHIETADGMWFVSGNQIVDGVPIYGTEVGFTLNASGEIVLLGADVYPAVELPTNPSLSASAALAAAKAAFSETGTAEVKSEPRLTILPMGDPVNFYLTWQLELYSMDPFQDIVYFVDAASGQILHSFNNIPQFDYAETDGHDSPLIGHVEPTVQTEIALMSSVPNMTTASLATITITGRINGNYWPEAHTDPTATSGYPTTTIKLYNQLGQHITSFSTDRTGYYSVTYSMAPGIYIMQIPLQSTYVQIRDGSNSVPYVNKTVSLVSGTNTYNHTWAANDRANVKHHVDTMRDYFTQAPFSYSSMNYQMQAHIDQPVGIGSQAAADGTHIYFGDAFGYPWEETAEVIRHEYSHNVQYRIYGGWIDIWNDGSVSSNMAQAMQEGIADYFSSTRSGDPLQGETFLPVSEQRNLDNNTMQFNPSAKHYINSQVFSGAIWDIRQALGASITDHLAFRAMQITPRARTFSDYGYNMVVADYQLYGGSHESTIRTYFSNHGVSIAAYTAPPPAPTNLLISGSPGSNPQLTWNASAGATHYRVYRCYSSGGGCNPTTQVGSPITGTTFTDYSTTIRDCGSGGFYGAAHYEVRAENAAGLSAPSNRNGTCAESNFFASASAKAAFELPTDYALHASTPNPFSHSTEIRYDLPEAAHVRLAVYNLLGQEVRRLVDGEVGAGFHTATFEAGDLPSGVYLYRLTAGDFTQTHRMVLTK